MGEEGGGGPNGRGWSRLEKLVVSRDPRDPDLGGREGGEDERGFYNLSNLKKKKKVKLKGKNLTAESSKSRR